MSKERLYVSSLILQPIIIYFSCPMRLIQDLIVDFLQSPFSFKDLRINKANNDQGHLCVNFEVFLRENELAKFSQWIESFCRDKGIDLTDLYNNLKLKK